MGALERFLLLQIIDERWREHLFDMDYLREGIHLRGFAQIDPLVAYKNEAFTLFGDLMNSVWSDYARMIFNVQVNVEGENGGRRRPVPAFAAAGSSTRAGRVSYSGGQQRGGCRRAGRGRRRGGRRSRAQKAYAEDGRRRRSACPSSSSACSTTSTRSGATIPAGAAVVRSSSVPRRLGRRYALADVRATRCSRARSYSVSGAIEAVRPGGWCRSLDLRGPERRSWDRRAAQRRLAGRDP